MGKPFRSFSRRDFTASFTLVEMLVAIAILVILLGIVLVVTSQVNQVWRASTSRIQAFQGARTSFEAMTRQLSQATLNTYYDYYEYTNGSYIQRTTANSASFVPTTYDRVSDLHFICGQTQTLLAGSPTVITTQTQAAFFQAPLGYSTTYTNLENGLNASGYFLQFDAATNSIPTQILTSPTYKPRYRYRLMEMSQPTEDLGVYFGGVNDWFVKNATSYSRILAENVIAIVFLPKLPSTQDTSGTNLAPNYNYDSRIPLGATSDANWPSANPSFPPDSFTATGTATGTYTRHNQLPPLVHVVMIVIDEPSALRLQAMQGTATTPPSAINLAAVTPALFVNAANLANDIQAVENICNATPGNLTGNKLRLNYQIFSADVTTREAKWSNN
jgi:uncharacterized protein (TIGR02599 family)